MSKDLKEVREGEPFRYPGEECFGRGNRQCKALRQEHAGVFEEEQGNQYDWIRVGKEVKKRAVREVMG